MKHLKAVIFDVDGTIAQTERDGHRLAFNRAFAEAGLDWHWDDPLYRQLLALTNDQERLRYYHENFHLQCGFMGDNSAIMTKLYTAKTRHHIQLQENRNIELGSGVKRLIAELRNEDIPLALVTKSTYENVTAFMKATLDEESLNRIGCIVSCDSVPSKKSAPERYDYCLKQLQLDAKDCLVIVDSSNGFLASCEAGITILVIVNNNHEQDFPKTTYVVDQLGEPYLPCNVISDLPSNTRYITVQTLQEIHDQVN